MAKGKATMSTTASPAPCSHCGGAVPAKQLYWAGMCTPWAWRGQPSRSDKGRSLRYGVSWMSHPLWCKQRGQPFSLRGGSAQQRCLPPDSRLCGPLIPLGRGVTSLAKLCRTPFTSLCSMVIPEHMENPLLPTQVTQKQDKPPGKVVPTPNTSLLLSPPRPDNHHQKIHWSPASRKHLNPFPEPTTAKGGGHPWQQGTIPPCPPQLCKATLLPTPRGHGWYLVGVGSRLHHLPS